MAGFVYTILFLFFAVFAVPVLPVSSQRVIAAVTMNVAGASDEASPSVSIQSVEYVLPYPGMLPDHPLYFLKSIRDRIIEVLISDPVNKAEFYILQADKKLNMGVSLSGQGKTELADSTFDTALSDRSHAVTVLAGAIQSGTEIPGYVQDKMLFSLEKHRQVLSGMGIPHENVLELQDSAQRLFGSDQK